MFAHTWISAKFQSVLYHQNMYCKCDVMFLVLFAWWFWYFVQNFMQLFHSIIFLKSLARPLSFRSRKSWFHFWTTFSKFLLFWHQVILINSSKCFSILFVAMFCNYSRVLSMHHSDFDADSKLYYQKTACKRYFMFFVLSVDDFGTLRKISWKYLIYIFILLKSRIIPQFSMLMQSICTCDFLMCTVIWAWRRFHGFDDAFCMIHKPHVYNILHLQKLPCEYHSMFVRLFIWWYHAVILWNHQSHSKCFR